MRNVRVHWRIVMLHPKRLLLLRLSMVWILACCVPAHADELLQLAPGVWRVAGANAAIGPANLGAIANTGIITTGEGLIVIDPGPTLARGQEIAALAKTLSTEPVRWLIDTHAHPENVLANSAFPEAVVIASSAAAELMKSRCAICLQRLTDQIGAAATRGTTIRVPTRLVQHAELLTLGRRTLQFLVFERAHTRGDLAVLLPQAGILFAGGLANDVRVPDLREATLSGWISAIDSLQKLPLQTVVPGHGPAIDSAVLPRFGAYLNDLRQACDEDIAQRGDAASSGARLGLPKYRDWVEYAAQHPLNVGHAYREREDAQLMGEK